MEQQLRYVRNFSATLALCVAFGGCLEYEVLVRVRPDGSGVVRITALTSTQFLSSVNASIRQSVHDSSVKISMVESEPYNLEQLRRDAGSMGNNVRLQKVARMLTKDKRGYAAYYEFSDINTLHISQDPQRSGKDSNQAADANDDLTFAFTKGPPAVLNILQPIQKPPKHAEREHEHASRDTVGTDEMLAMLAGFRMSIAVEFAGTIVGTNAAFVDSNRVTLMEFDLDKLFSDKARVESFKRTKPQSIDEAKEAMRAIPGMKFEMTSPINVSFQ